ncbi:cold shock domain-containing protein [Pseudanabaena sp. UWO311]|uniref:cold shock domain-containing protein n=1 Tax=Pseudanabaena sp. UWO311 TaxID=2487337 RepID=UPI0011576A43|nr:cold shock domain-containing protein [Pseudanabaena sp. UWO311]TYQ26152.1 cold shock domain-containing protein [Pseudanabaena sp. UWO311]
MQSFPHQGQLTTWKDDRGFGFIKPDDGSKEVFLHISVLKGASRRPIAGDTIFYEEVTEENGKIRASKASIQGVLNQPKVSTQRARSSNQISNNQSIAKLTPRNKQSNNHASRKVIFGLLGLGLAISLSLSGVFSRSRFSSNSKQATTSPETFVNSQNSAIASQNCNIKGNISVSTGSKLYHLPGMEDYATTNINESKGERWFCSESEAIANGWSKAPR